MPIKMGWACLPAAVLERSLQWQTRLQRPAEIKLNCGIERV